MAKKHGKEIKNDDKYEALKEEGMSKEKAARIANTPKSGKRGGKAKDMEDRTKAELVKQAKKIGINKYSTMNKDELIHAIRNH